MIESWQAAQSVQPTTTTSQTQATTKGGVITTTYTVKDTGERKQMFGYTARHLITTMESVSSPDACDKNNSKMPDYPYKMDDGELTSWNVPTYLIVGE